MVFRIYKRREIYRYLEWKEKTRCKKKYRDYVAYATQTIFEASKGQVKLPKTIVDPQIYAKEE